MWFYFSSLLKSKQIENCLCDQLWFSVSCISISLSMGNSQTLLLVNWKNNYVVYLDTNNFHRKIFIFHKDDINFDKIGNHISLSVSYYVCTNYFYTYVSSTLSIILILVWNFAHFQFSWKVSREPSIEPKSVKLNAFEN